ncbi:MAG: hypothetical protein KJP08_08630 [Gammaproteobacteria bacterium]|nr:hypothetical protein [Gammaproteobacteria bacterium]MBT8094863.1 hypothetical protein [Gammaproteobacteria bacterium]
MLRELTITTLAVLLIACPAVGQSNSGDDEWKALNAELVDSELRVIWATFCAALRAGDAEAATELLVPANRDTQLKLHELLGDQIKTLPDNWSDLTLIEVSNPFAKYALTDKSSGLLHTVTFLRYPDGKWLIQSM